MKLKNVFTAIFVLCTTAVFAAEPFTIEKALKEAAATISNELKKGSTIAIVGISSDSDEMSDFMLDELAFNFLEMRKLTVADRKSLDAIKKEMKFQLSGEVSDETIQRIGALTGAKTVLSGILKNMGSYYMLTLKALDVSTGTLQSGYRQKVSPNETTEMLLAKGGKTPARKTATVSYNKYSHVERFRMGMANYFVFGLGSYLAGYTADGIGLTVTHIVGNFMFWGGLGGLITARSDVGAIAGIAFLTLGSITEFVAFLYGCIVPCYYDKQYSKIGTMLNNFKVDLVADNRGAVCPRLSYTFRY